MVVSGFADIKKLFFYYSFYFQFSTLLLKLRTHFLKLTYQQGSIKNFQGQGEKEHLFYKINISNTIIPYLVNSHFEIEFSWDVYPGRLA